MPGCLEQLGCKKGRASCAPFFGGKWLTEVQTQCHRLFTALCQGTGMMAYSCPSAYTSPLWLRAGETHDVMNLSCVSGAAESAE